MMLSDAFWLEVGKRVFGYCQIPFEKPENSGALEHPKKPGVKIFRNNHGTAHGMRQAVLARDILDQGIGISHSEIEGRKHFKELMILASAMQRTGRRSEDSVEKPELFEGYLNQSGRNFVTSALEMFPDVSKEELSDFYASFTSLTPKKPASVFIKRILDAAHYLDLIRVYAKDSPSPKDNKTIVDRVCECLNVDERKCSALLSRAQIYLDATGVKKQPNDADLETFFQVSLSPETLVSRLLVASQGSRSTR